jgi:hypothetical protein
VALETPAPTRPWANEYAEPARALCDCASITFPAGGVTGWLERLPLIELNPGPEMQAALAT